LNIFGKKDTINQALKWQPADNEALMLTKYLLDQNGATAIEYGLIAAAMGVALVLVMPVLASQITVQFSNLGSHIASGK
jgi:Flp pilus assembly pilin Flp